MIYYNHVLLLHVFYWVTLYLLIHRYSFSSLEVFSIVNMVQQSSFVSRKASILKLEVNPHISKHLSL